MQPQPKHNHPKPLSTAANNQTARKSNEARFAFVSGWSAVVWVAKRTVFGKIKIH